MGLDRWQSLAGRLGVTCPDGSYSCQTRFRAYKIKIWLTLSGMELKPREALQTTKNAVAYTTDEPTLHLGQSGAFLSVASIVSRNSTK